MSRFATIEESTGEPCPEPCEGECECKGPDPAVMFHAHLDECKRCANEPFNLCVLGTILLNATAGGLK